MSPKLLVEASIWSRRLGSRSFRCHIRLLIYLLIELIMLSTKLIGSTSMIDNNSSTSYDLNQGFARVHPILLLQNQKGGAQTSKHKSSNQALDIIPVAFTIHNSSEENDVDSRRVVLSTAPSMSLTNYTQLHNHNEMKPERNRSEQVLPNKREKMWDLGITHSRQLQISEPESDLSTTRRTKRNEQNNKKRKKMRNNETHSAISRPDQESRTAGRAAAATRPDAATSAQANQVRSQNQMQTRVKRETEKDNQFQSSASLEMDEHEPSREDRVRPARAAPAGPTTSQQQQQLQPFIQAIAGQRLVIPCRNLSSTLAEPSGANQPQASASVQLAAQSANNNNNNNSNRRQMVVASSRFKTTTTQAGGAAAAASQTGGISLIVWHKDEQLNAPIFAADARGAGSLRDAKQQASSESLRGRAHLDLVALGERGSAAPALVIDEASLQDAGLYTCVVEFLRAPTQTFKTRISVIEPPRNMIIREVEEVEEGGGGGGGENNQPKRIERTYSAGGLIGPYDEDSRVTLACEAEPGKPTCGQVTWWRLDSVTQLGHLAGNYASVSPSSARKTQLAQLPVTLDAATHLTTLSIEDSNRDLSAPSRFGLDYQATATSGPRDLYLGPHSLQSAAPTSAQVVETTAQQQQLASQLPTINHLISGLNLTASSRATARLRHWRRIDDNKTTAPSDTPTLINARLELPALSRSMLGAEFLCLATNDLYSLSPLNTSVTLNLNLNPTEVKIVNRSPGNKNQSTFTLGQKTMVECQVVGSKPSPSIKWFRGPQEIEIVPSSSAGGNKQVAQDNGKQLTASELNRDMGNLTKISYLTFVPQLSDNQQTLTCSASNARMPGGGGGSGSGPRAPLTDSLVMNVQHEPKLSLELGANIRPDSIRLGSDIFMDCHVEANPPIQELVWLHQGRPLVANISAGVIMSKQSLVLRNLALGQRGAYQCQARNLLGRATSEKLELRPLFEPQCDQTLTRSRHEVALNQPTRIECHVLAEPAEGLHFTWRFNRSSSSSSSSSLSTDSAAPTIGTSSSSNLLDGGDADGTGGSGAGSALSQYETNFTRSSVIFTPRSRRHFGTLLCSAANSMGRQARPCVIQLVQSELPEPVLLCFDDNIRPRSFSIHCTPPATTSGPSSGSSSSSSSSSTGSANTGSNRYVLEVYMSQEDSSQITPTGTTHLRLRDQPTGRSSDAELTSATDYLAGGPDGMADLQQADEEPKLRQVRIKRLLSESPTFDVADLRPNSSYNVLVYVQNSKGRSPAFHHQVSTQPEEGAEPGGGSGGGGGVQAAASTHHGIELSAGGGRGAQSGGGATEKVLAYLKLDDYFSSRGRGGVGVSASPLVGVALVILLASVSLVTLVFFVNRLICNGRQRMAHKHERGCKLSKSSTATTATTTAGSGDDDDHTHQMQVRDKRAARLSLAGAHEWRSQAAGGGCGGRGQNGCGGGGAGSGSDTSRETNTDSTTLVLSPKPTTTSTDELSSNELAAVAAAQHQRAVSNYNCQYGTSSGLVVVAASPSQAPAASNRRCSQGDLTTLAVENLHQPRQSQCKAATMMRRPNVHQSQQQQQQQQQQQPLPYDPAAHYQSVVATAHQMRNQAASCTPQMSVHSSECTSTSNNVDVQSLDLMRAGCSAGGGGGGGYPPDGGVYVIQEQGAGPSDFWCDQLAAMSMASGDPRNHNHQGGRCQLIDGNDGSDSPCLSRQQLPSSFSIPVSLSDRLTLIGAANRPGSALQDSLRLSQDNLAQLQALGCYPTMASNNSYLTLAGGQAPLYGDFCSYQQRNYQHEPQMPSPPVDFGGGGGTAGAHAWHHHHHHQTDLDLSPAATATVHSSNCAASALSRTQPKHRVKFDTSSVSDCTNEPDATSGPNSHDTQRSQQEPTRV